MLGHAEPDADCLGSQLALASAIERLGGRAVLASAGPFLRPEISPWEANFLVDPTHAPAQYDFVVVADCSTSSRLGTWREASQGRPLLVVDHHSSPSDFEGVRYIDPAAPSTALMVYRIFQALNLPLDVPTAYALALGSCTDTGFFRHLGPGNGETLRMFAHLSEIGVSLQAIHALMNSGQTAGNIRLLGVLLGRVAFRWNDQVAIAIEEEGERERLGATQRPSDWLYQLLFTIDSVELIVVLRTEDGETIGGLRSRRRVDCARIASRLGGGGHVRASGFRTSLPPQEVIEAVMRMVWEDDGVTSEDRGRSNREPEPGQDASGVVPNE